VAAPVVDHPQHAASRRVRFDAHHLVDKPLEGLDAEDVPAPVELR
jgi:hypothetical protein